MSKRSYPTTGFFSGRRVFSHAQKCFDKEEESEDDSNEDNVEKDEEAMNLEKCQI